MPNTTKNYGLNKPMVNENVDINVLNANMDIIDEELKKLHGTVSVVTMSASGWSGKQYSFESSYPASEYDIEIALSSTASQEQIDAYNSAMILSNATSNIAVASGEVPSIDIPVILKAVRK